MEKEIKIMTVLGNEHYKEASINAVKKHLGIITNKYKEISKILIEVRFTGGTEVIDNGALQLSQDKNTLFIYTEFNNIPTTVEVAKRLEKVVTRNIQFIDSDLN
ncbi:hypothetical protein [Flavobacterium sp.]|uniref:hypothetical protein n=1 Tax=Flavobacterium sp. TaxID=239 RepID=UPI0037522085